MCRANRSFSYLVMVLSTSPDREVKAVWREDLQRTALVKRGALDNSDGESCKKLSKLPVALKL